MTNTKTVTDTYSSKLATLYKLSTPRLTTFNSHNSMELALESFKAGIRYALKVLDEEKAKRWQNT
jgi:hypothetical protein